MTGHFIRTLAALFVTLGILAPQSAGVVAALGLADGRVLVICTGDGLRTLRIDENGVPVELSDKARTCALVHAADTAAAVMPVAPAMALVDAPRPALPPLAARAENAHSPALPRAPPAA